MVWRLTKRPPTEFEVLFFGILKNLMALHAREQMQRHIRSAPFISKKKAMDHTDAAKTTRFWEFIDHLVKLGFATQLRYVFYAVPTLYDGPGQPSFKDWLKFNMEKNPDFLRDIMSAFEFARSHPVLVSAIANNKEFYPLFSKT